MFIWEQSTQRGIMTVDIGSNRRPEELTYNKMNVITCIPFQYVYCEVEWIKDH
jgi:hypothetical protein